MRTLLTESSAYLTIQENICCDIANFRVEILSHLGQFADIHYFKVILHNCEAEADEVNSEKLGLLRVGSTDGGLNRELKLRQALGNYKMVAELLATVTEDSVYVSAKKIEEKTSDRIDEFSAAGNSPLITETESDYVSAKKLEEESTNCIDEFSAADDSPLITGTESEYLEEEFYEEIEIESEVTGQKLIILSYLPNFEETLEAWLAQENCLDTALLLSSQICQFFRYAYQQSWCFIQIFPQFIQMGTPVKFFDLTGAYPVGEKLTASFLGNYCAPEIAYDSSCTIDEQISTYTIGALLYQAVHQKLPDRTYSAQLEIKRIPRIYQILKLCLSPIPEERFSLSQLLSLLVESRKSILTPEIHWNVYGRSTLGLSTSRLQNEDNYGVWQQYFSNGEPILLAVVADGMGGMAQGEVASRLAVETVLEAQIPSNLTNQQQRTEWLVELVQKANACVTDNVRDGGTTLSLVMAVGRDLTIAHVGDSRIFLLRNKQICQLSEDHSMVATLLAGGQITYEESQVHPDRNVLIKSLGSKRRLSDRYVQDLSLFGANFSLPLENGDILLLCSDGVWDLVPADKLADNFTGDRTINSAVELTIEQVLARGAHDNATILALKCNIANSY